MVYLDALCGIVGHGKGGARTKLQPVLCSLVSYSSAGFIRPSTSGYYQSCVLCGQLSQSVICNPELLCWRVLYQDERVNSVCISFVYKTMFTLRIIFSMHFVFSGCEVVFYVIFLCLQCSEEGCVLCGLLQYNVAQCSTVWPSAVQCGLVQCSVA